MSSERRKTSRLIGRRFGVDYERVDFELTTLMKFGLFHTLLEATNIIVNRLEDHGYPEPHEPPPPPKLPKCLCCYRAKVDCTCGIPWFGKPKPVPDVPEWMRLPKVDPEKNAEESKAKVEPTLLPCKCGAGLPRLKDDSRSFGGKVHRSIMKVHRSVVVACVRDAASGCGRSYRDEKKSEASRGWNKEHGVQPKAGPSWDDPPPCSCGQVDPVSQRAILTFDSILCKACFRQVRGSGRALVLQAWTEGRGKSGKVYYVDSEGEEQPAEPETEEKPQAKVGRWSPRGTSEWVFRNMLMPPLRPCRCGGPVWSIAVTMDGPDDMIIRCNRKECTRILEGPLCPDTVEKWNTWQTDDSSPQYDSMVIVPGAEATWDNPGPCTCGESENIARMRDTPFTFLSLYCQSCGRRVERPTRSEVLTAWKAGEVDGTK